MRSLPILAACSILFWGCQSGPSAEGAAGARIVAEEWANEAADEMIRLAGPGIGQVPPSELAVLAELAVRNTEPKFTPKLRKALEDGGASGYFATGYIRSTRKKLPDRLLSNALAAIAESRDPQRTATTGAGK